jgi:amino acid transporter
MEPDHSHQPRTLRERILHRLFGRPLDIHEPSIFHKISLIPILAWIGLGADGLSSSAYGPEEAFKALGPHTYLALFLALATAFTVIVISYAYSRIIEHFPHGGGGYVVATHTLGNGAGVVAGGALLVDYVLTIAVSLAACGDAVFSYLPTDWLPYKIYFGAFLILVMLFLNLRGVKESVTFLAPIFIVFVVTHVLLIGWGLFSQVGQIGPVTDEFRNRFAADLPTIGMIGILAIFFRAFSLGGGTYTGIEAVANAMHVMREPKVQTGKRTMVYLAASLAFTAGGLLLCYALFSIEPVEGRTLNAILADRTFAAWPLGAALAFIPILSEGALLMVGAQAGFAGGPSVMANMALDSWLPRRFAAISERLTMQNGVLLMAGAALITLFYAQGSVSTLVVMYSINVFLTFALSQLGMMRFFHTNRDRDRRWKQHIAVHIVGFILCVTILVITVFEKFGEGGWVTLAITLSLIALCTRIRRHYSRVRESVRSLEDLLGDLPSGERYSSDPLNPRDMTAIILVTGYNGFGIHTWLSVYRQFPKLYRNFIFVSVAEIDTGSFKGAAEIEALGLSVEEALKKYVTLCRSHGYPADYRTDVGTEAVETATRLCEEVAKEFPRSTVFAGQLVFREETPFQKILHNETAFAIQRRLQWQGITAVILPVRVGA